MDPYNNNPDLLETDTDHDVATWDFGGYPCRVFSMAALLEQGKANTLMHYVWPYEGQFKNSKWKFHKGKVIDGKTEVEAPTKPLLVDGSSARAFMLVYEAINDKNKAKMCEFAQSRGLFCWAMETLVWPFMGFGGRS